MLKLHVKELENYWRHFFNNSHAINKLDYLVGIPPTLQQYFRVEYLPEPFYGYLTEDMREDVVLLLLNPGDVNLNTQQKFFNVTEPNRLVKLANAYVAYRHMNWSKEDYLRYEKMDYPGKEWRKTRLSQCEKIVGHSIPFLHTIELFPYHSKNWNMKKSTKEDWLYNLKSTHLFVNAIEEISKNKLSKYIFGIGKDWVEILSRFSDRFYLANKEVILGPNGGRAHSIYQFKLVGEANSLPIIIYSGVSMNLPVKDKKALQVFKRYLE